MKVHLRFFTKVAGTLRNLIKWFRGRIASRRGRGKRGSLQVNGVGTGQILPFLRQIYEEFSEIPFSKNSIS